jgi:mRNA interferase MazF
MKTGDIVLVPFPFAELNNLKLRPAVVVCITSDKYKDIVVCAISSVMPVRLTPKEILLPPNKTNKLRVPSVIKIDRIVTLKAESIVVELGRLSASELSTFKTVFKSLVD